jgi:serine/threonine protein phosphatase 1
MGAAPRKPVTWVIGDIHGDFAALERLLSRLPALRSSDTLVFLGDYCDRGPDSDKVIAKVRGLQQAGSCRVVALRGNHEDMWVKSYRDPNPAFLLHRGNGCITTWRSYTGKPPQPPEADIPDEDLVAMLRVKSWLPDDVAAWMASRPAWYEDDHAIYVHAGLDGANDRWSHPSAGREKPLLWMRETAFYTGYRGKRVVFGHTRTAELPNDHRSFLRRLIGDATDVWKRGDLIGLDTGAGMGGFLSAVCLPSLEVIESR